MISKVISKLVEKKDLSESEMEDVFEFIMNGKATPAQIGAFLVALRMKGETVDEICGAAKVMKRKAKTIRIKRKGPLLDTCGTGGDSYNTFNISTAAAFVVSAGGVMVAKHGNRSVSSKCGSADVLEELGAVIDLSSDSVKRCIEEIGIGFMFAPLFHKAMRYVASPRKELSIRTIFNLLGPLTNPAGADVQVLGVFSPMLTEKIANVLKRLGIKEAMVISGLDGMDEASICAPTRVSHLKEGEVKTFDITPEQFGIKRATKEEIIGGDARENAKIIRDIFSGSKGAKKDIVVLNSAFGFVVSGKAKDIKEGVDIAKEIIEKGYALKKLEQFIGLTRRLRCTQS